MRRSARSLGREIPKRTIERIARSPRRHRLLKYVAAEPSRDCRSHRFDGLNHAFDGFAIASVRNALAAPTVLSLTKFSHDDRGFGLGAAADRESARDRPAFDVHR
jgi:hypothetical protein